MFDRAREPASKNLWTTTRINLELRTSTTKAHAVVDLVSRLVCLSIAVSRLLSDPIPRPEWPGRGPVASFRRCSLPVKLLDCSRLSGPPHLLCPQLPPNSFSGLRRMFVDLRLRCSPILPLRLHGHR